MDSKRASCFDDFLFTFIAESSFKSRETITLACHMMTRAVTVHALRTRLTAAVPKVTWRTDCRNIEIMSGATSAQTATLNSVQYHPILSSVIHVKKYAHTQNTHCVGRWSPWSQEHIHTCLHQVSKTLHSYSYRAGSSLAPSDPQHTHCHSGSLRGTHTQYTEIISTVSGQLIRYTYHKCALL